MGVDNGEIYMHDCATMQTTAAFFNGNGLLSLDGKALFNSTILSFDVGNLRVSENSQVLAVNFSMTSYSKFLVTSKQIEIKISAQNFECQNTILEIDSKSFIQAEYVNITGCTLKSQQRSYHDVPLFNAQKVVLPSKIEQLGNCDLVFSDSQIIAILPNNSNYKFLFGRKLLRYGDSNNNRIAHVMKTALLLQFMNFMKL
ncbi:hypothetical protein EIN_510930 [Entamoeba invadens IP1]|uniref:Uncharacterized protein n=1 Tax=Entamoeba invadens IP1 TaxID=370355 RepID=A0A0A1TUR6_ENTIV|nr:hypothetical protein EIN_510930 [Entamoeba invadens IP1]ELP83874.1 hypothetical protein EIN_510930 [Entamoeba invadens IP1]|eukprot:XP_004183220.1 hypothetical protein EIN_510930 [Entamoeba invadens IP1]